MKNKKVTLESTAAAFNKWRETKRNTGDAIPLELWEMVIQIYDHYPHTLICSKLNLKVAQLKSKGLVPNSQDFTAKTTEETAASPFVHVPPTADKPAAVSPSSDMPSVEIHRPDGVKIVFKHHDNAQLILVLQQLIGA
jgi:hypothetical protein